MAVKKVRISDESLNSYGTRIITSGGDLEDYRRNPVLLYMHERGNVIGTVDNIEVVGTEIIGELNFDEAGEKSQRIAKQWEKGSLRMVSAGLMVIEMSEDPKMLVPGQTSPTITKWKLREVSVVDIAANPNAIRLYDKDGVLLDLSENGSNPLPKLKNNTNTNQTRMDQKELALALGLAEDATMEQIQAKITQLMAQEQEIATLREQSSQITLGAITSAVETAISERRLAEGQKEHFIALGQKMGLDDLKITLAAMQPAVKASAMISGGSETTYKKLSEVPSDKLMELRENDPEQYKKLYKAEYGVECKF